MAESSLLIIYIAILGSMVGSFLNVCIYRLPKGESIITPRSHCPYCASAVRWYDNLPLFSYLLLRGRCRSCRERISLQYPLVEAAAGGLAVAAFLKNGPGYAFAADTVLLFLLLGIAITDWRSYTIPDLFSVGGVIAGLAFSFSPGGITPLNSVLGLLLGGGLLYLIALSGEFIFKKEAMGGGDIKMLAMIGAFLGWPGVLFTIFAGSLAGSLIFGWINYVLRKEKLVPFGIFLSLGAFVYLFAGRFLIGWYLSFFY